MDNLFNFNGNNFESFMFGQNQEQERKVHTPFIEPQDFFLDESKMNCISQKIQFNEKDIVLVKKAKSRKTKTIEDANSSKRYGHWSCDENKRYHWFLEFHHEHFFNKQLRRTDRIFKSMASFVQTREAEQCRSHHQKMQKKYKDFSKILISLRLQNYSCDDTYVILQDMHEHGHNMDCAQLLASEQLRVISQNRNQYSIKLETNEVKPSSRELKKSRMSASTLPLSSTHLVYETEMEDRCQSVDQQGFFHQYNAKLVNQRGFFSQFDANKQCQPQILGPFLQSSDAIDNIFDDTYEKNIALGSFF